MCWSTLDLECKPLYLHHFLWEICVWLTWFHLTQILMDWNCGVNRELPVIGRKTSLSCVYVNIVIILAHEKYGAIMYVSVWYALSPPFLAGSRCQEIMNMLNQVTRTAWSGGTSWSTVHCFTVPQAITIQSEQLNTNTVRITPGYSMG